MVNHNRIYIRVYNNLNYKMYSILYKYKLIMIEYIMKYVID